MRVMKFRIVAGVHVQNNVIHQKGTVIESVNDLCAAYRGKFERVPDDTPLTVGAAPAGAPTQLHPIPAPDNPAFPSNPPAAPAAPATAPAADADDDGPETGPMGVDVTAKFPVAGENDYRVFKHEKKYFVYDADNMAKPVNPAGAARGDVDGVIRAAASA